MVPAGTGKTYNTKNIIVNHAYGDVDKIDERYRELQDQGRVQFVTFHQSFAYEDFIEGIKPNLNEEAEGNISYKVEKGIFKELCNKSIIGNTKVVEQGNINENLSEQNNFWKMSLGNSQKGDEAKELYEYCIDNDYIALGWGDNSNNTMFSRFKNELSIGDYIFISNGNLKIKALAKIIGNIEEANDGVKGFNSYRKVEWILKDLDEKVENLFNKRFSQQTFYSLSRNLPDIDKLNKKISGNENIEYSPENIGDWLKSFYKKTKEEKKKYFEESSQNYYLIIDEINRGNISKIFGELITLLESSKRLGEDNELTTILPYSKDEFGIPPNLYIIGTMNTSDKSIAHLDIALRRRFGFVEMLPKYDLKDGNGENLLDDSCAKLLEELNQRIEILLDKDHLIGHSFFCGFDDKVSELKKANQDLSDEQLELKVISTIMQNEIVPLLEEYFYGDYEKIQLVLGNNNISSEKFEKHEKYKEIANIKRLLENSNK